MYRLLEDLEDQVKAELQKIVNKKDMTPLELDSSTKAICLLDRIFDLKKDYESEDSSYRRMKSRNRPNYDFRYDHGDPTYYSEKGYSNHDLKEKMIDRLEDMMRDAKTDHEREIVNKWIDRISED